jgi:hypothetical protein
VEACKRGSLREVNNPIPQRPQVLIIDSQLLKLRIQFYGEFEPCLCLSEATRDASIACKIKFDYRVVVVQFAGSKRKASPFAMTSQRRVA